MSLLAVDAWAATPSRFAPSSRALHQGLIWAIAVVLAVLAVIELALSASMLAYPGELMYGEAVLFDHARRIVEGVPLYQPIENLPYSVASYTPVFYWLAGALQWLGVQGLAPCRALALAALLAATALVGCLAAAEGRGWRTGLLAGLIFFALGAPGSGSVPWTALYKEDSLALALALGSVAVLSSWPRAPQLVGCAGLLLALAILTKQTYLPLVLPEVVWLWRREQRMSLLFIAGAVVPVVGVALALEVTTGAFFANTVLANVNPLSSEWLVSNLVLLALFQAGPVLAACTGLLARESRRSTVPALLLLTWACSGLQVLAIAKLGGASNHWLAFAALSAVVASRAMVRPSPMHSMRAAHWIASLALAAGLVVVAPITITTWLASIENLRLDAGARVETAQLVDRIRQTPGAVLADPLDVLVLADKHPLFEPLLLSIFDQDGRWDVQQLVTRVCDRQIGLVVVDRPVPLVDWPLPLRKSVESTMQLEGISAGRRIYVPRPDATCSQT